MKPLFFILTILLTWNNLCLASAPHFCKDQTLEDLPILQAGRVKPLKVHANEVFKFFSGKKSVIEKQTKQSALTNYCLLSLSLVGAAKDISVPIRIDHSKARELLGTDQAFLNIQEIIEKENDIRVAVFKEKTNSSYKKELEKILNKLGLYQSLVNGQNWVVYQDKAWVPIINFLNTQREKGTVPQFEEIKKNYIVDEGKTHLIELTYYNMKPFSWAMLISLLALLALGVFKKPMVASVLAYSSVMIQVTGFTYRTLISGRAPITNMYETVVFSGLGALILGLIISVMRKERVFILVGLCYNILCLMMAQFANSMLDASIQPLVPVLRDNFWLSTHVTTIILSYAALALSWVLANLIMIKDRFFNFSREDYSYYSDLAYTAIKWGVVLLAAGIILGGVWADYSWGRFWGWDPKETWSLIVLLIYIAILHGRYTKWIHDRRFIPCVALAFLSVMMAWFGVNYILAAGLHSYGFSEGGAYFLIGFFIVQIIILFITLVRPPKLDKA